MSGKKEKILLAAELLFSNHGFDGTSVRDLAKEAGVNLAMISYYFGSKEKLFEALVEYRAGVLREKLASLQKEIEDPGKRLEHMIDIFVDRIFAQKCFHRILYRQLSLTQRAGLNEAISDILMRNANEIRKTIIEGIDKKLFRAVDPGLVIITILGTISQVNLSATLTDRILGIESSAGSGINIMLPETLKVYLKDLMNHYLKESQQ